ncbi:MAG TPA: SRPBCC domain-containing protein [Longimicrobium sp.]|jgi:hypothetical protein
MKIGTKRLLVAGVVLAVAAGWVVAEGARLPVEHTAQRTVRLDAPPEAVWALIATPERFTEWRSGVRAASTLRSGGAWNGWREEGSFGPMAFTVIQSAPPRRLVARVTGGEDFGGTWSYVLEPAGSGTRLTIIEDGEVYSPVFRFVSRYVMGHHRTIDGYVADLRKALPARGANTAGT